MQPDLVTKLIFNTTVLVEFSSDYVDTVMVKVYDHDDEEQQERVFQLEIDEIDLFIATLNLYKNRIAGGRKNEY
ncbi:hypothetical protein PB01_08120 [Psychrobacillus glaciei]|uniref:Uncharacterized protein n=1 Tax=Psychrobacillus glaciei TaxID=2283160 RepID=A0A5J6SLK9_9BACI|nr:hypothetical protein [Psychrobacillus glaciei]QFF98801.1 hypothetical protein PB01_08120 [Psychrobacillus glaciei]